MSSLALAATGPWLQRALSTVVSTATIWFLLQ